MKIEIITKKATVSNVFNHNCIEDIMAIAGAEATRTLKDIRREFPDTICKRNFAARYGKLNTELTKDEVQLSIELDDEFVWDCMSLTLTILTPFVAAYHKANAFVVTAKIMLGGFKAQVDNLAKKWAPESYTYKVYRIDGLNRQYAVITKHDNYGNSVYTETNAGRNIAKMIFHLVENNMSCCKLMIETNDEAEAISRFNELKNEISAAETTVPNDQQEPEATENAEVNPEA